MASNLKNEKPRG